MTNKNEIYFKCPNTNKLIHYILDDITIDLEPCGTNIMNKTQVTNSLKESIFDMINNEELDRLNIFQLEKLEKKLKKVIKKVMRS